MPYRTETVQVNKKKQHSDAFLVLYAEEITVDKVLMNITIQKVTALKVANFYHCATSLIQKKFRLASRVLVLEAKV